MKSLLHDHITKEVERIGRRHKPKSPPIFAARLKDGLYLPSVCAYPSEQNTVLVTPNSGDAYLKFNPINLGYLAYANAIIHGDQVESVEEPPYFLPDWLFEQLISTEYRAEHFALRIQMSDTTEFTLVGGVGMSCYCPPAGYSWTDVKMTYPGYDHSPINPIRPMIQFYCILTGLSFATIRKAEQGV